MPITIPTFGGGGVAPSVTSAPQANGSADLRNFGGGQSAADADDAIGGELRASNQYYVQQKKEADDARGQEVYAQLTNYKNKLIYDQNNGAMTQKGQNALNVVNDYGQQFKDYADQVANTLTNDEQRKQFDHFSRITGDELNQTLSKYVYSQSQDLAQQKNAAALDAAKNDAILNYQEPGKVEASIELQRNALTNSLRQQGMPQEVIDDQVRQQLSSTYSGVVDRMVANGQDSMAKSYYDSIKDQVTAKDAIALDKTLEASTMRGESQRASDGIIAKYSKLSDALEAAREIQDPKLRDETTTRVKQYYNDQANAQKQDDEQQLNAGQTLIEKSGGRIDAITPQMWANYDGKTQEDLKRFAAQVQRGYEPPQNSDDYLDFMRLAAVPEARDEILQTNLGTKRGKWTNAEIERATKIQTSLQTNDDKDGEISGLRTRQQIVSDSLSGIGLDKDKKARDQIDRQLQDQMVEFYNQHKRKANGTEIQDMVDNIIVKAKDPNAGFLGMFQTSRLFQIDPSHQVQFNYDDIPVSERNQITQALKARNITVTPDKVVDLYSRRINAGRGNGQ